jgi:hypothetical protein
MKPTFLTFCMALMLVQCQPKANSLTGIDRPQGQDNIAYYWAQIALEATANDTERYAPRPTITSRFLGLVFVAVFDAWSVYEPKVMPLYLKDQPKQEGQLIDKETAISFAAYYALKEYYPADSSYFKQRLRDLGLVMPLTKKLEGAAAIGKMAAQAVINARKGDGANQYGEAAEGFPPYYDYTQYKPVNSPELNSDINRWQPKYFTRDNGEKFAPSCLTPYWQKVRPIALDSAAQFRSPPPPLFGSYQLAAEVAEVVAMQSNLTTEQKGLVEFMRDGPKSVQQAGHWLVFAQEVSKRDGHSLDEDVKMYFLNQITAMDAFIASWDTKMYYDYARPYALVHEYFQGKDIEGWKGIKEGWGALKGEQWRPYSPEVFLCPPFPSYVSGHSTVSAACAEALRLFKGSDFFGHEVSFMAGSLTEPESQWQEIKLHFPTFTEAGEMAGISRVWGGYHIQADNVEGLVLGRKVAQKAFDFYKKQLGE